MDKILIIDGGGKGNRVKDIITEIRSRISSEELIIKYSISNINENGKYHNLSGYKLALIHDNDNVDNYGKPIFNIIAKETQTKLILYSGGFVGFFQDTSEICKINDNLLKSKITNFLKYLIRNNFNEIDFKFLYPGEKYIYLEDIFKARNKIFFMIYKLSDAIEITDDNYNLLEEYLLKFENLFNIVYKGKNYSLFKKFFKNMEDIKNNLPELINKINSCVLKIEVLYEES